MSYGVDVGIFRKISILCFSGYKICEPSNLLELDVLYYARNEHSRLPRDERKPLYV